MLNKCQLLFISFFCQSCLSPFDLREEVFLLQAPSSLYCSSSFVPYCLQRCHSHRPFQHINMLSSLNLNYCFSLQLFPSFFSQPFRKSCLCPETSFILISCQLAGIQFFPQNSHWGGPQGPSCPTQWNLSVLN